MSKKLLLSLCCAASLTASAQTGPGLVISEFLPNPAGTDSPFEYVELVATRTIDFSITPYSVVWCNNGTATASGWVSGGALSYGFNITSGTVNQGDVVYVGGTSMAPTGTQLRAINTGTTNGDGFGTFNTSGVMGNGGTNADGIAVFDVAVTSLTSTTVPVDAVFYGTAMGTAVVGTGTDGYQLPYNDLYAGGKLQTGSYLAPDPGAMASIATGVFNPTTGSFTTARSYTAAAATDGMTAITFASVANVGFSIATAANNQTVNENGVTATFNITVASANNAQAIVRVDASSLSNATAGVDYTISNNIIVAPAGSTTSQIVTINISEDVLQEQDEYVILNLVPLTNATVTGANIHALYIKDNDNPAPAYTNELNLQLLSSYNNGTEGTNSAEIVAHDAGTQRLFVANSIGRKLDILDFSNPAAITSIASIDITPYGNINSVAVFNGLVAAAMENGTNPQDSGSIVFFDANGNFINSVKTGAMPDMITFTHAGDKVITACEGEPNAAYTVDPEGRIVVVDISGGAASVSQADAHFINFTAYIGQEATLRASGIRIYGPGANAAQDFEPEYVTVSDDDQTAWVSLQENNAIAIIDLSTNTITDIKALGFKDHNVAGNGFDISDQAAGINIANFNIKGMYLPDAISHINMGGNNYIITANEGDARAYAGFSEESRISGLTLDAGAYPNGAQLKSNVVAGRLTVTNALGDTDGDGDIDQIYSMGARSFSIWNGTTGALVYDSGDDFERITSQHPVFGAMFNASNTNAAIDDKNRSDDKGPETEGVTVAEFNGEYFAFASLERIGGVMIYNISNPAAPQFVGYHNNRDMATNGPDRGAEGMIFIQPSQSPNGNAILLLANEISSTLSVFQVNPCSGVSGVALTGDENICAGDTTAIYTAPMAGIGYQWYQDGVMLGGETDTLISAAEEGRYTLHFNNTGSGCSGNASINLMVNALPTVTANATATIVCENEMITLNGSGADTYTWTNGVSNNVAFAATIDGDYIVTGTDVNGCSNRDTISITVNTLPNVTANATDVSLCAGETTILTGSGAGTYTWTSGITNGMAFMPGTTNSYIVTGTDGNGCSDKDTITIAVNPLPMPVINFDGTVLSTGIYTTIQWSAGGSPISGATGPTYTPTVNGTYTVEVTNPYGCEATATYNLTTIGMAEAGSLEGYKVYPNPFSTAVKITVPAGQTPDVMVVNAYGQQVFNKNAYTGGEIDLSDLVNGMYLLLIRSGDKAVQFNMVKQ